MRFAIAFSPNLLGYILKWFFDVSKPVLSILGMEVHLLEEKVGFVSILRILRVVEVQDCLIKSEASPLEETSFHPSLTTFTGSQIINREAKYSFVLTFQNEFIIIIIVKV